MDETIQPLTEEGTITGSSLLGTSSMPGTPAAPMRFYVRIFYFIFPLPILRQRVLDTQDPNDPTTFPPGVQVLRPAVTPQGGLLPQPSQNGTGGNTLPTGTNMKTSRPQGYHGLPAV
jgi:hypothetical protein